MAESNSHARGAGAGAATDIGADFERAAEWMRRCKTLKLSTDQKLKLYGLFKQASKGPNVTSKPGIFDMTGRAKWDAWKSLGIMTAGDAMRQYVTLVTSLSPRWRGSDLPPEEDVGREGGSDEEGGGGGGSGRSVSTLMNSAEAIPDEKKTIFDWCKEGHIAKLSSMLTKTNVNSPDEQGMSLLHWACDRGRLDVVQLLVSEGAEVNQQDQDLQTPLHYATSCSHGDVVAFLAAVPSINKELRDCDGATATEVTSDPNIRVLLLNR